MTKPQLVVSDLSGHHSQNMPDSIARLQQGASWKKHRTVMVLPSADLVPAKCALSWMNLLFPPNNGLIRTLALGDEVGIAYSKALEWILATPEICDWEYMLTIEHDNAPPQDGVLKLTERMEQHPELHAIGGLYWTKGYGGQPQIWGDIKDPVINYRPVPPDQNGGLVECYGVAMGFTLYRLSMFKDTRLQKPWFKTLTGREGQGVGTQDLVLWNDARKYGYRCAIDCGVKVGHFDLKGEYGPSDTMW